MALAPTELSDRWSLVLRHDSLVLSTSFTSVGVTSNFLIKDDLCDLTSHLHDAFLFLSQALRLTDPDWVRKSLTGLFDYF